MSDLLNVEQFFGRSLDTVYCNAKVENSPDGEKFRCGICHKEYKTKTGAEKHLAKRNCHSAQEVFMDTEFERTMLHVVYYCNKRNYRPSKYQFRDSHSYKPMARLTGYMYMNLRQDMFELYIDFILRRYKINASTTDHKLSSIALIGQKESTLMAFREHLLKEQQSIPAPRKSMIEEWDEDPEKFVRAVERCDVSLDDAEKYTDIDSLVDQMSEAQKIRLEEVCYQIEYANM